MAGLSPSLLNLNELKQTRVREWELEHSQVPIRYCEFKISNTLKGMLHSATTHLSQKGAIFFSPVCFHEGTLLRIFVEIPDYWRRKAQKVEYRLLEEPSYFQMLSRVVTCHPSQSQQFEVFCENLNLDPIDQEILTEYLKEFLP